LRKLKNNQLPLPVVPGNINNETMKVNEVSVTFFIDKTIMKDFDKVIELKESAMWISSLTRKQALKLAIRETTERWAELKRPEIFKAEK
jgi:hypothetical protein